MLQTSDLNQANTGSSTEHQQNIPRHTNHITITKDSLIPRPSHCPVFDHLPYCSLTELQFCKWSRTGWWEGLGMRLN